MSIASKAWTTTPLPPKPGNRARSGEPLQGSKTSKVVTGRVIPGEVISTTTLESPPFQGPQSVRSNVRGLFSNDRAESLPMWGWVAWAVWSQAHRLLAEDQARMLYLFLTLASAALFVLFVTWKVRGPFISVAAWGFVLMLWTLLAVTVPLTLGWVLNLGVGWALALLVMYLPLLRVVLNTKYTPPAAPIIMQPGGLLAEPVDDFAGWPEMEGGAYDSPSFRTETGTVRTVQLPHGKSAVKVAAKTDEWANHLRCPVRSVEVVPDEDQADRVAVFVHTIDVHATPQPWPWLNRQETSADEPIPFGIYRSGEVAHLDLRQQHVFLGGLPGGGKTVGLNILTAAGAMDPIVEEILLDGKLSELQPWRERALAYVGDSVPDAIEALGMLERKLQERNEALPDLRINNIYDAPHGMFRRLLLIVDEMEAYTTSGKPRDNDEFCRRFQRLGKMGRSGGLSIVGTTQRPQKETFPPGMLATFGIRVAYRCADGSQTRLILGENVTVDASRIPGGIGHQGKAYVGSDPRMIRGFCLSSEEAWRIAERLPPAPVVLTGREPVREPLRVVHTTPTFPDGTTIPEAERSLWDGLQRPLSIPKLESLPGTPTYKTIEKRLRGWESRGWLVAGRSGNAATYRRTDVEAVA